MKIFTTWSKSRPGIKIFDLINIFQNFNIFLKKNEIRKKSKILVILTTL